MKKTTPLNKLIHQLIKIEPDSSPLISCFVNIDHPRSNYFTELELRSQHFLNQFSGKRRDDFQDALAEVREYLEKSLKPESKSVAIYCRWGESPTFVAHQFQVPMETALIVDDLPHIYPLVELKDTYRRFVIVLTNENEAQIMETTIGAVTEEILTQRPEIRQRVGREWTKQHYRNHKRERSAQFVREKVRVIESLMNGRGINYLILTGNPKMVGRLKRALPNHLKSRLLDAYGAATNQGVSPILLESLQLIIAAENIESHDRVAELEQSILSNGLGVAGYQASKDAIEGGYADVLVIDQDLEDEEMREELVRLAAKASIEVETVRRSDRLKALSGVGCLLRYRPMPIANETPMRAAS